MLREPKNLTVERLRQLPVHQDQEVWEIAILSLPMTVREKGDPAPWHPLCVVCASSQGGAMTSTPCRASELAPSAALDALASFALDPHAHGAPPLGFLPARVHVSGLLPHVRTHLADALNTLGIRLEEQRELPAISDFATSMFEALSTGEDEEFDAPSLRRKGVTVERIRAFADAAAAFWTAAPWKHFPNEVAWSISPRPRTLPLRHCLVMGGGDEEFGLGFLPSATEVYAIEMRARLGLPVRPRGTLWSMTFEHISDAPRRDRKLWLEESLPLADAEAFPIPLGFTESDRLMRPNAEQLTLMEGLLRGFASIRKADARRQTLTFSHPTFDGETSLVLTRAAELS